MREENELFQLDSNPVRRARKELGLSLPGVARRARVNYQTWYLTERGCYADVPPAILEFLEEECGRNPVHLSFTYRGFVTETRARFREQFSIFYPTLLSRADESRSCRQLSALYEPLGLSRTSFAKLLCVQPAVLYKYESGKQHALPAQLRRALQEVGFPDEALKAFT